MDVPMILRYRDSRVAVYDNSLLGDEQHELLKYLDAATFRKVLPAAWGKAFLLASGEPLVGLQVLSAKPSPESSALSYPTETALDILIRRVFACRPEIAELLGPDGSSWTHFTVCPYVYPAEAGLGWHTDGHVSGAYIYYAHSQWRPHWGGELLVAYSETDCAPYTTSSRGILRNEVLESALSQGLGYYFAPLPNRIIFLRAHTPHMIKTVDRAAGDNLRLSLSGFFLRSDSIAPQSDETHASGFAGTSNRT
jgi:hypothetical protein